MATAAKFVLLIAIFLAYLIQLDMDVTGNITAKLCEVGSEFNIFRTLVTMTTAAILNFFNPPKAATYYGGSSYKVDHNISQTMDINSQHQNLLGNQISPKSENFCILVAILD